MAKFSNRLFQKLDIAHDNIISPKVIEVRYICNPAHYVGVFRVESFELRFKDDTNIYHVDRKESTDLKFVLDEVVAAVNNLADLGRLEFKDYYKEFPLKFPGNSFDTCWVMRSSGRIRTLGVTSEGQWVEKTGRDATTSAEAPDKNAKLYDPTLHMYFAAVVEDLRQDFLKEKHILLDKYEDLWDKAHDKVFQTKTSKPQQSEDPLDYVLRTYI